MSTRSVLIPSDNCDSGAHKGSVPKSPRYSLLLCADTDSIEVAQRLRYDVFAAEPGFTLPTTTAPNGDRSFGLDADHFDQFCDHLLVRDDDSGELVGCYRMLPPPGAIAAGGLYTATEFDLTALDPIRPSLVEMGRAVVRAGHRNGAVVLLMWRGILAYLDRSGYDYVAGCVSVPVVDPSGHNAAGSQVRGVRDFVMRRHAAPSEYTVRPFHPVVLDGRGLDDIDPPERLSMPPLMRGYLRIGAQVCGEPAYDPVFGVGDFPALLDKRQADIRYLRRLRSVGSAAVIADRPAS
ncbi:MAG: GNAT family N-acetyltransferase [Actinomycetia bacterium]|nr:GNAT family N-acetyltransferase [Actinomycetes bacterium]MCH9701636.1 GNAT family N-acetyltransferase [Actinomycetes bacterium]MCH9761364.1 GNAT family N-acetyltransferase [Actinomycetes bacterium]